MLLEINKNLAKLAKQDKDEMQKTIKTEKINVPAKNTKIKVTTAKAKVVSHKKSEGFQNKPIPITKTPPVKQVSYFQQPA